MPKFLKNIFEKNGKKNIANLVIMLIVGVVLLLVSAHFASSDDEPEHIPQAISQPDIADIAIREQSLADELAEILSLVAGAGQVRVMLTYASTPELVVAQNHEQTTATTTESDTQGGERNIENRQYSIQHVMVRQQDGSDAPLILSEHLPRIGGVIIVAEGGGSIEVAAALTRAAHTVLGIAPHQVQVFQMR